MGPRSLLLLLLLLATAAAWLPAQSEDAANGEPQVIVVPITGHVDVRTAYMVQSSLREAHARGIAHIVLDIDTLGGSAAITREVDGLLSELVGTDVQVVAFVRRHAVSAGAYIALACSDLFMAPGSTIGAVTPVMEGPNGIQQIPDPDVRHKLIAALRGDMRAMVERRGLGHDVGLLAEAMVDPDMEVFEVTYLDSTGLQVTEIVDRQRLQELQAGQTEILRQTPFPSRPLLLTAQEAARLGLSSGTVDSVEALVRQEFLLPPSSILYRHETWSEGAVAWLNGMKPILFVVGFVLLLVEMKTPGFALPGILGLLLLALAMFGSYLVGLADWIEIVLFFAGIALVAVEIFVLPGTVIVGLTGLILVFVGLILSQQSFFLPKTQGQSEILLGNLLQILGLIGGAIVGGALLWKLTPYIPVLNNILQPPPSPALTGPGTEFAAAGRGSRHVLVGRTGVAGTDLRPVGSMELDGEIVDVMTRGTFVSRGTPVKVIAVELNQVVVEPVSDEAGEVAIGFLILLWILGVGFIIAEVFFPSFGVLGTLAAVSFVSAIFLAYTQHGPMVGHLFLGTAAVAIPVCLYVAFKLLPNTSLGRRMLLQGADAAQVTGAAVQPGLTRFVDRRGKATSALRPAGIARIDGESVDVVTRGEMIERGATIVVVRVEGNRVVVRRDGQAVGAAPHTESNEED